MSRMLDALRQHRGEATDTTGPSARPAGVSKDHVLASLGYAVQAPEPAGLPQPLRLAIGALMIIVTAGIVWQVFASNHLVSTGPLTVLLRQSPVTARRTVPPPIQRTATLPSAPASAVQASAVPASGTPAPRAPAIASAPPLRTVAAPPVSTPPQQVATSRTPPPRTETPAAPASGVTRLAPGSTAAADATTSEAEHFRLAVYYQRTGDFEQALVHYRAVIEVNQLNAEAHNNLGLLYQDKGLYDEAISEFRRATIIDARYDKARNNLGVALLRSGKTEAAVAEFRWIVAQDARNVESLTNLALALRASGRLGEARDHLQRALSINNRYANAHYNLALVLEESAEISRAIDHYEQFLSLGGADSPTLATDVRDRIQLLRSKLIK
jgi:Flp pilus assembly protein TadD